MLEVCLDNPQVKDHHEAQWNISDILSCQVTSLKKKISIEQLSFSSFAYHWSLWWLFTDLFGEDADIYCSYYASLVSDVVSTITMSNSDSGILEDAVTNL